MRLQESMQVLQVHEIEHAVHCPVQMSVQIWILQFDLFNFFII